MSNGYYFKCDECDTWVQVSDPFRNERRMGPWGWITIVVNVEGDGPVYRDYCSGVCASRGTAGLG